MVTHPTDSAPSRGTTPHPSADRFHAGMEEEEEREWKRSGGHPSMTPHPPRETAPAGPVDNPDQVPGPLMDGESTTTFSRVRGYGWNGTGRWRCDVCGRRGLTDPDQPARYTQWFTGCQRGHSPCVWCGRQLTVRMDGTPRVHSRCPQRPDDAELLRLLVAEVREDARLAIRGPITPTSEALLARLVRDQPGGA